MKDLETLAQALYSQADQTGIWVSEDQVTKNHYRRQAQQEIRDLQGQEPAAPVIRKPRVSNIR